MFGFFGSTYDGSEYLAMNKPAAGSACAPPTAFDVTESGVLSNADGSLAATPVPANLVDDANGLGYVVANADLTQTPSASFVSVYSVQTNGTDANGLPAPAFSGPTSVPVPSYALPADAPQNGSPYLLDTLDGRFEAAVAAVDPARGNKVAVWTAHAVFGGAGAEERWYEIDPAAGSLLQSGSVTSSSLFVTSTPCRWGDYSGATPDPAATDTVGKVWLGNQYNLASGTTGSTAWRTWLAAVTPAG
jgi:hypothetical protein